jgi:sterol desaturase/sphingolipid hydroxylase (fatty acid hydroxylase superfamily)
VPHEELIRLGCFVAIFSAMAWWEVVAPRRTLSVSRVTRWPSNLAIVVIDRIVVRLLFPLMAVGVALFAESHGWGFFRVLALPRWAAIVLAMALLDLAIYLQHVVFHAIPAFWRVHRMHHADLDIDVTTGVRFHPVEIALSMAIRMMVIAAIGAPAVAVVLFEVLLNATSMFNHSNAMIPLGVDRILRWFVVTPDMHRVHHSVEVGETNSNFGFNLPWWDLLLGTYQAQPAAGHLAMTIGIKQFRDPADLRLDRMLLQPLRGPSGEYPLGREAK